VWFALQTMYVRDLIPSNVPQNPEFVNNPGAVKKLFLEQVCLSCRIVALRSGSVGLYCLAWAAPADMLRLSIGHHPLYGLTVENIKPRRVDAQKAKRKTMVFSDCCGMNGIISQQLLFTPPCDGRLINPG
jgi:hypothetical protein